MTGQLDAALCRDRAKWPHHRLRMLPGLASAKRGSLHPAGRSLEG